jgi:two-component system response regulator HydG
MHFTGLRPEQALVPVDCSALTPTLIESELFGHVKGAFTGADRSKLGVLQAANEGAIFLDEIGELSLLLQVKLLPALQAKEIRPVGSIQRIPINGRAIAATNRDLEAEVRAGTFRQDLYFRLNVVQIKQPALRQHEADIPLLVAHFLEKFSDPLQPVHAISDDALRRLIAYDWPGNVREPENAIECAAALSSDSVLAAVDLASVPYRASAWHPPDSSELVPLEEIGRRAVLLARRETGGEKLAAARLPGIGKTTLYRNLRDYAGPNKPTNHQGMREGH